jgi:hypothetical protein
LDWPQNLCLVGTFIKFRTKTSFRQLNYQDFTAGSLTDGRDLCSQQQKMTLSDKQRPDDGLSLKKGVLRPIGPGLSSRPFFAVKA